MAKQPFQTVVQFPVTRQEICASYSHTCSPFSSPAARKFGTFPRKERSVAFLSGRPVFLTRVSRCGLTLIRHAKKGRWNERAKVCLALMTSLFLMSDSSYEWAFGGAGGGGGRGAGI